jgi:hypothetical protein
MPLVAALVIFDVMFVWHAVKTGRACPWAYVILAIPGFGAVAYLALEIVPEWLNSIEGQKAQAKLGKAIDPEKRYRLLTDNLMVSDTVSNRVALAEECLALQKFDQAKQHFAAALARPQGDEPSYQFGVARAEFGLGHYAAALATLDALRARWADYQSAEAHLVYAQALERSGRGEEALDEFRALASYHSGAEARVRMGLLLQKLGRTDEAKVAFCEVLTVMQRQPKFARKAQAEWIARAEVAIRG